MVKFEIDQRVIFSMNGSYYCGRVTAKAPRLRRVVTDSGKRFMVPVTKLKASPDRALLLETRLDRSLRSSRAHGPMMQQWLHTFGVEAHYERMHTIDDFRHFLKQEGRRPATRYIHIMGHGRSNMGSGNAVLQLTFGRVRLLDHLDVFADLNGKIVIFSCCEIGADRSALETIKEASGASAIIAYRTPVNDWYTNLVEVMLYERLINTHMTPRCAVELVADAIRSLGVRTDFAKTRMPVLVCI